MDQIIGTLTDFAYNFFVQHPKLASLILMLVVIHTAVKAFVDALVSSRAQWDKTPTTDDTWYEKALTVAVRTLAVTGKALAYLAGFRPKAKAEIQNETK